MLGISMPGISMVLALLLHGLLHSAASLRSLPEGQGKVKNAKKTPLKTTFRFSAKGFSGRISGGLPIQLFTFSWSPKYARHDKLSSI